MPDEAHRLYELPRALPGADFAPRTVAALTGNSTARITVDLTRLVEAERVEEHRPGRYRLPTAHTNTTEDRALAYYLRTAVSADLTLNPHKWHLGTVFEQPPAHPFESRDEALRWMDAEVHNLAAGVNLAHTTGRHPLSWQLCEALRSYLVLRKHHTTWERTYTIGPDRAGNAPQRPRRGRPRPGRHRAGRHRAGGATPPTSSGPVGRRPPPPRAARRSRRPLRPHPRPLHRASEPYMRVRTLRGLALTALAAGEPARAASAVEEALRISVRIGAAAEEAGLSVLQADLAQTNHRPAQVWEVDHPHVHRAHGRTLNGYELSEDEQRQLDEARERLAAAARHEDD